MAGNLENCCTFLGKNQTQGASMWIGELGHFPKRFQGAHAPHGPAGSLALSWYQQPPRSPPQQLKVQPFSGALGPWGYGKDWKDQPDQSLATGHGGIGHGEMSPH